MSTFYGQVFGHSQTEATRRGFDDIKVSAQSWRGSVITRLTYSDEGVLMVNISLADGSQCYGDSLPYFYGTFEDLKECFRDWGEQKELIRMSEKELDNLAEGQMLYNPQYGNVEVTYSDAFNDTGEKELCFISQNKDGRKYLWQGNQIINTDGWNKIANI